VQKSSTSHGEPSNLHKALREQQQQQQHFEQQLPTCGCYSSGHVLVNRERKRHGLAVLCRSRFLDDLARSHAETMAEAKCITHSVSSHEELQLLLQSTSLVGENVIRGRSIREMHAVLLRDSIGNTTNSQGANMLSDKFTEFGMGTAKGGDGRLYMVHLFRSSETL
jgi:uncharacterized protein YkwD